MLLLQTSAVAPSVRYIVQYCLIGEPSCFGSALVTFFAFWVETPKASKTEEEGFRGGAIRCKRRSSGPRLLRAVRRRALGEKPSSGPTELQLRGRLDEARSYCTFTAPGLRARP